MRMDSYMPGMLPKFNFPPPRPMTCPGITATDAAVQRRKVQQQLIEKTAALMEADRHDDDAASEILIAAGAVANAMRIERDAVAQMRQSSA